MQVILIKDIENLGQAGNVVKVANGYGRNYLLPKKIAIPATKYNLNKVNIIKENAEKEQLALTNEYKILVEKINDIQLTFYRKADENGHLFGSVSENDIVQEMKIQGIKINRSNVIMEKHFKKIGSFEVDIEFSSDLKTTLKVAIERE